MNRIIAGLAAAALVSGGVGLAGLGAGTAQADNDCGPAAMVNGICYGPNQWCPGDSLFHLTQNHVYNPVTWDMNVCHTYWHVAPDQANQGQASMRGPIRLRRWHLPWGGRVDLRCHPRLSDPTSACRGALSH
jgi:hypothetical protein